MASSLLEVLRSIPDHRRAEGKRFDLAAVLLCTILGMVAPSSADGRSRRLARSTSWLCAAWCTVSVGRIAPQA